MPVTFKIASHGASEISSYQQSGPQTAEAIVSRVWSKDGFKCGRVVESSFTPKPNFNPKGNGFIDTVIDAYNQHHNLVIRPDDLWIAIISQFSFYVNKHAEELRSKFVAHEGKEHLTVDLQDTFGNAANALGDLLKTKIKDPSLHDFITPNFSTTTPNDKIICSIIMMSTLKAYFSYGIGVCCGIPSITLEGEKEDYASILGRLEKLEEFGEEPTIFARLLRPVLREFVAVFDVIRTKGGVNLDFWGKICHYQAGFSGPSYLSGWITAFAVWNSEGEWLAHDIKTIGSEMTKEEREFAETYASNPRDYEYRAPPFTMIEGLRYPVYATDKIPSGSCEVDITIHDDLVDIPCAMVAGHVAMAASSSGTALDTVRPEPQWFLFTTEKTETQSEMYERRMVEILSKINMESDRKEQ